MIDHKLATTSGVPHGEVLLAFAEAMVGENPTALAQAREGVIAALGPAALADAAGVASNFERMVRIADSTGIQLDERMEILSKDVRDTLQLERFTAYKERE